MAAKKQNYVQGAAILAITIAIVKVIGLLYKLPLLNIFDDDATADFNIAYSVYSLLLTISTAGVPVAISRMISASVSTGRIKQANRIFSVAMPTFAAVGALCALIMMVFAAPIASFMENPGAKESIFILGPAVFFCCIIAVYRGYTQGHEDMVPTSVSQIIEVLCKLIFGLGFAFLFVKLNLSSGLVAAGGISGAVIGLGVGIPVMAYYKRKCSKELVVDPVSVDNSVMSSKDTLKHLLMISIPMTLSSSLLNIITLVDVKVVMYQLKNALGLSLSAANAEYAAFTRAHTIFTLPSSLIVSISVSVVPAIAAAIALKKYKESAGIMSSSLKLMNLFALPAGMGICVLSDPIYRVFYWYHAIDGSSNGPLILAIMGIASYFVCFQLVSTALVQASGSERVPLISMAVGSVVKLIINWTLVGTPSIGIIGAPISTLVCYMLISIINMIGLMRKAPVKPKLGPAFIKPLICTGIMGAAAWGVYGLLTVVGGGVLSGGRIQMGIAMMLAIIVAVIVYGILIIVTGTITKEDMKLVPKGDKIASILHLK